MVHKLYFLVFVFVSAVVSCLSPPVYAQDGAIEGTVTLSTDGQPVSGAMVLLIGAARVTSTDDTGRFTISNLPPGTYQLLAQRDHLTAARQTVSIQDSESATVNFSLQLLPVHEDLTVTATSGGTAPSLDAFNAVTTLDSFELASNPQSTLGEVLQNEPGVAKRSFGPGASRPIIRGFDGDRILIMEDGVRTGDLSSQSGDHGVLTDPNGLDRIEIVRGPATLLYGSNAIGGVVNAITPHETFRDNSGDTTRGQFSIDTGSADAQMGSNVGLQHRQGKLLFWGAGGARRTGDYNTPDGTIENSATQLSNSRAGFGYLGDQFFATGGLTVEDGRYGIPFAGDFHSHGHDDHGDDDKLSVKLDSRRRAGRFDIGMNNLRRFLIDNFRISVNVIDWEHDELEIEDGLENIGTAFANRTYIARAEFTQQATDRLTGKFGLWTQRREYVASGEEALSPPTEQASFAAFAYQEIDFGRYRVQFGGRLENNTYTVGERVARDHEEEHHDEDEEEHHDEHEAPTARDRDFTGESVSMGFLADLGRNTAFVTNVTLSHRAPSLGELYNFGPHTGSLMFEIGNSELDSETTVGLDIGLRHQDPQLRASFNTYRYSVDNFVFGSMTDRTVDGLRVANFLQADSRFVGFDAEANRRLGGGLWLNAGLGFVDAELTTSQESLPRIAPFRGRLSLDVPYKNFTLSPEVILAASQDQVYRTETATGGYSVINMRLSYVWARATMVHSISAAGYNLTNELYRNHTSFIKDLAPEIGRGVRIGYSVRFF